MIHSIGMPFETMRKSNCPLTIEHPFGAEEVHWKQEEPEAEQEGEQ